MAKIMAISNQKGGVGKTVTTINLGAALKEQGYRVLLFGIDPQRNFNHYLSHDVDDEENTASDLLYSAVAKEEYQVQDYIRQNHEGIDYIPNDRALIDIEQELGQMDDKRRMTVLKNILYSIDKEYDYILLDCPPSLCNLTVNAFAASDSVLIAVETEQFATDGLEMLMDTLAEVKQNINPRVKVEGILFTKITRWKESRMAMQEVTDKYDGHIFQARIRSMAEVPKSIRKQKSCIAIGGKVAEQYRLLAKEITGGVKA